MYVCVCVCVCMCVCVCVCMCVCVRDVCTEIEMSPHTKSSRTSNCCVS